MKDDLELKVTDDKNFIINIISELFAYEINNQALELGLEKIDIDMVYNSIHTEFNRSHYKDIIYNSTSKILKEKYRINIRLD